MVDKMEKENEKLIRFLDEIALECWEEGRGVEE